MESVTNYIPALLIGLIGFIYRESIKKLINSYFSNLSKAQINMLFYIMIIVPLLATLIYNDFSSITPQNVDNEKNINDSNSRELSDAEMVAEVAEVVVDVADNIAENRARKDSIHKANLKNFWVYQIGTPKSKRAAWDLYKELEDIEMTDGICFYKEGRNTYNIIKHDGLSDKAELENSFDDLKSKLNNINEQISIIDLQLKCKRMQSIYEIDKMSKKDMEVRCYECDK